MKKIFVLCIPVLLAACQTLPTSAEWMARGTDIFRTANPKRRWRPITVR